MYKISELIPQRAPIIMVDEFLGMEGQNVSRSRLTVRADNIFVDNGVMDECGVIEHIAQSAAARIGYICREARKEVPLGYIGSVNDFHLLAHPKVDDTIETIIEVIQEVFNISLIEAHCCVDGNCIATCRMKIYLEQ